LGFVEVRGGFLERVNGIWEGGLLAVVVRLFGIFVMWLAILRVVRFRFLRFLSILAIIRVSFIALRCFFLA
jgi:hypothetical protein